MIENEIQYPSELHARILEFLAEEQIQDVVGVLPHILLNICEDEILTTNGVNREIIVAKSYTGRFKLALTIETDEVGDLITPRLN